MKTTLKRLARLLVWGTAALVLVAGGLLGAGWLLLRSNAGRDKLLALALSQLESVLPGGVQLGRSEGDLTRGVVLYDLVIRDREEVPAITVERLELRYSLGALLAGVVQVDLLDARGVTVVSRRLGSGADNLATLGVGGGRPAPAMLPVAITVEKLEIDARFVRLPDGGDLADAPHDTDVRGHIAARGAFGRHYDLELPELAVEVRAPTRIALRAHGGARVHGKYSLTDVVVHIDADPSGLHRKVPGPTLGGPIVLDARGHGPIDDLAASLRLDVASPALRLSLRTRLHRDRITLEAFKVDASFARIVADGTYRFDQTGEGTIMARVTDLAALTAFGAPPLAGRVRLDGHLVRSHEALQATVQGQADELVVPGVQAKRLKLDAATGDEGGHAKLEATGVVAGGVRLRTLNLDAEGTPREVHATVSAAGNEGIELDIGLSGVPRIVGTRVSGFEATLQRLRLRAGGSPWIAEHPAHVSADFDMKMLALSRLRLTNDIQQITLEARLMGQTLEGVFVDVKHFDLSQLPGLISPGHVLPRTDLSLEIDAHGPLDDPEVDAKLTGEAYGKGDNDLIHATGNGDAKLSHGRLGGKAFVTIGGQTANVKFDLPLPLRPAQPIDVSFDTSVLLSPLFAELLVPKLIQSQPLLLYALGAKVTGKGRLSGTTTDPELHVTARVARWAAGDAHGDLGLSVEYGNRRLNSSITLELSSLPAGGGTGGGIVALTSDLPVDLSAVLTGGRGQLLSGDEPLHAELKLRHVGLDHLPFQAFNVVPPVQHGWVDAQAELAGNRADPRITASLDAVGLTVGPVSDVDVHGGFRMKGGAATADARLTVHGSEAFRVHGSLDGGTSTHALRADWRKSPIAVAIDINDFDLGRLGIVKGLSGVLRGRAELTGSLAQPRGKAEFGAFDLRMGQHHHRVFRFSGTAGDGALTGKLNVELDGGQSLIADARVPWPAGPLSGRLIARGFSLDFGSETLPLVRLLRGLFDGELRLGGTLAAPRLAGEMRFGKGEVHLSTTAMTYRDIETTLAFSGDKIEVPALSMRSGTSGSIQASGAVALDRLLPSAIDAKVAARQFPIQRAGIGVLLDADITISGRKNAAGVLAGSVRVDRGRASLPTHPREGELLPTASLEDVTVVTPPLVPGRTDKQPARPAAPRGPSVATTLEGPFEIRGEEVSATTRGSLSLELSGDRPVIRGALSADPDGWVRMFGRRYEIERGRLRFDGVAQPELDFRISHRFPKTRIGVDVKGPATNPELVFWSDPPIYDPSEVVGVMLVGSPTAHGVSTLGLAARSEGVISRLVVTSIQKHFLAALPIDVYRAVGTQNRPSNPGSQIELGKYLTESLYVGYAYQIGTEGVGVRRVNHNEARVDYHFSRRGQLEAKGGDAGVGGLDLFWTFRP